MAEVTERADGVARYGVLFAAGGALVGFVASTILAVIVIVGITGLDEGLEGVPIQVLVLLQVPLWLGLGGAAWLASRTVGTGSLRRDLGLGVRAVDAPVGLVLGVAAQLLLVPLIYVPIFRIFDVSAEEVSAEARALTDRAPDAFGVVVLVVMVVFVAPFVEELFYRGLLQRALVLRMHGGAAVLLASIVFGVMHLQLLQLPALVGFGLVAGTLAYRTGRLGGAIVAHMAFNGVTVAVLLLG